MAYKYQRFSDLLYTNYSGLKTLGFDAIEAETWYDSLTAA